MSLFRKREMFDRTDVPRESPYRNVIGAVVCVVVLSATALVVSLVWNRVKLESRMGDADLADAVSAQSSVSAPSGYVATEDDVSTYLLLTASSLDASGATLSQARVLALNTTQGTAALAAVPTEVKVTSGEEATTLADLYSRSGYPACVAPLSAAAGVGFDHVVVTTGDVLEEASTLVGGDASNLVSSASGFLSKIRTDMDAVQLVSLAEALSSVGVANVARLDAVLVAETSTDADGNVVETGYQLVDKAQLGAGLGLLVAAA